MDLPHDLSPLTAAVAILEEGGIGENRRLKYPGRAAALYPAPDRGKRARTCRQHHKLERRDLKGVVVNSNRTGRPVLLWRTLARSMA